MKPGISIVWVCAWVGVAAVAWSNGAAAQAGTVVYRCPGNPVLYTDTISAKEAATRGCKALEGAPITVIQMPKPRAADAKPAAGTAAPTASSGSPGTRIDPAEQRARDSDARRILEAELKREDERLTSMKAEYNNGEPERLGSERNFQKYQDRVADMKSAIARKESDIAALKREVAKHPQ